MKRPRRTPLTPARVVDAAIALLDREGADSLSMRRLGSALGVEAMALYNHFEHREALLDAIADRVFDAVTPPHPAGRWDHRLSDIAVAMRAVALAQPNVFKLAMSRPTKPTRALPLMDGVLGALREAGLDETQRVHAYFTLSAYIRGFLLWEIDQTCVARTPMKPPEGGSLADFPEIASVSAGLAGADPGDLFRAGLESLLRGLANPARLSGTVASGG